MSEDKFEVEEGVKSFLGMLTTDCKHKNEDIAKGGEW